MRVYKFAKIVRKTKEFFEGKVYDLEVKGPHSYNIDGLIVHNSAAGSVISWFLGITEVDPVRFNLLFERFLHEDRSDPPD